MNSKEPLVKEFENTTEMLPFTKYGVSTLEEFNQEQKQLQHIEWLKKIGLSNEEIKLYQDNEAGLLDQQKKIEPSSMETKLVYIYNKISSSQKKANGCENSGEQPSTSQSNKEILTIFENNPNTIYSDDHPITKLKEIRKSLFDHLEMRGDQRKHVPISKRSKFLRRFLVRKKQMIAEGNVNTSAHTHLTDNPDTLWDKKETTKQSLQNHDKKDVFGPKKQMMYTIKDNKILRLEPMNIEDQNQNNDYKTVEIVLPVNPAEEQLLEGTKMSIDNIRKIDRFKDYEPGSPSKVLYLKNIAPTVTHEQLAILFNQFILDNGGPIDVRLLAGRMRGQAFVSFQNEDTAINALEEINGTILSGRPIIAQFGRNSNRIVDDHD